MVVFTDASPDNPSGFVADTLESFTRTAQLCGHRIYPLPADFDEAEGADAVLDYLAPQEPGTPGFLVGWIPLPERYAPLVDAASVKGVRMLNSTEEHLRAMEFDRFYPLISDLTAKSVVVATEADIAQVEGELDYPVFVKGLVKSRKEQGWEACIARNRNDLLEHFSKAASRPDTARGKIVAREILPLRRTTDFHHECSPGVFPHSVELRCIVVGDELVGIANYWGDRSGDLDALEPESAAGIRALAHEAARRLRVPLLVVDVGQLEHGTWKVIETGDPQTCGMARVSAFAFFTAVSDFTRSLRP